jgi:thioredoxin-related protein
VREPITIGGHTFQYKEQNGRGYHELAVALLGGKMSFPTVAFLDEQARLIQAVPGYQEPQPFDQILSFFAQDAYKTTTWEQFVENYQSPFESKK